MDIRDECGGRQTWSEVPVGRVAQWRGSGEALYALKLRDGSFVNLRTGELVRAFDVASEPWQVRSAELLITK